MLSKCKTILQLTQIHVQTICASFFRVFGVHKNTFLWWLVIWCTIYDVHSTGEHDLIAQMHAATKITKCILLGTLKRNNKKIRPVLFILCSYPWPLPAYYKMYIFLYFWLLNPKFWCWWVLVLRSFLWFSYHTFLLLLFFFICKILRFKRWIKKICKRKLKFIQKIIIKENPKIWADVRTLSTCFQVFFVVVFVLFQFLDFLSRFIFLIKPKTYRQRCFAFFGVCLRFAPKH